ncbi:MAG: FAD binding domain-containing protein [Gemmatimonadaceae bacterium]
MYPAPFEYHAPGSLDDAIALLGEYGEDAKLIAGGHSLLPLMKLRFTQPAHLIDLRKIPGLAEIRDEGSSVVIGARTTHAMLEASAVLQRKIPLLAETAGCIGDPIVRNIGTIGGSLAHADPGADLPAAILALEAEMTAVGPRGARIIPAREFFVGTLTTALDATEVLSEIRVPVPPERSGSAYEKFAHPASRYALVGVAAIISLGSGDVIQQARVGITGVGTRATRSARVEQALTGKRADDSLIRDAASHAADGLEPRGDLQGPPEYKAHLVRVSTRKALNRALESIV